MRTRTTLPAALAATLLLLAGCGDESGSPSASPSESGPTIDLGGDDIPKCAEVWKVGATLPKDYAGCNDGDTTVDLIYTECTDGSSMYVHHKADGETKTHIAITGKAIQAWTESADTAVYQECRPS